MKGWHNADECLLLSLAVNSTLKPTINTLNNCKNICLAKGFGQLTFNYFQLAERG